jgi:hypothetical protein
MLLTHKPLVVAFDRLRIILKLLLLFLGRGVFFGPSQFRAEARNSSLIYDVEVFAQDKMLVKNAFVLPVDFPSWSHTQGATSHYHTSRNDRPSMQVARGFINYFRYSSSRRLQLLNFKLSC